MTRNTLARLPPRVPDPAPGLAVTGLRSTARPAGHVRVFVGAKLVGTVRLCDVRDIGLSVGAAWTAGLRTRTARALARAAAWQDAMKFIKAKRVFVEALSAHLRSRGHATPAAAAVIAELQRLGVLDDRAAADDLAHTKVARTLAPERIVRELRDRGADPRAARRAVAKAVADDGRTDSERAEVLARSRLRVGGLLSRERPEVQSRRLFALLSRRGFDDETAREVVERLVPASAATDAD